MKQKIFAQWRPFQHKIFLHYLSLLPALKLTELPYSPVILWFSMTSCLTWTWKKSDSDSDSQQSVLTMTSMPILLVEKINGLLYIKNQIISGHFYSKISLGRLIAPSPCCRHPSRYCYARWGFHYSEDELCICSNVIFKSYGSTGRLSRPFGLNSMKDNVESILFYVPAIWYLFRFDQTKIGPLDNGREFGE